MSDGNAPVRIDPAEIKLLLILATPEETVLRRLDVAEDTVDLMLLKAEVVVDFSVFHPLITVVRTADTEKVVRLLIDSVVDRFSAAAATRPVLVVMPFARLCMKSGIQLSISAKDPSSGTEKCRKEWIRSATHDTTLAAS